MIKKILTVITCLVITFLLTIVPCFANSVSPSDEVPNNNNYMGINWSGVSLDKSSLYSSYYKSLDDFQLFIANNIDALTYTNSPYKIIESPFTPNVYENITNLYANSVYNSDNDVLFRGAYHNSTYVRNFRNTSVLNSFTINDIRQWTFHDDIDLYDDVLYINCVLPYGVINDIISGDADRYLTLTFNYTVDILSSYNRGWNTVSDSVSFGLNGTPLSSILLNAPLWTNSIVNVQDAVPNGFEVVTFHIPYTDILEQYKQKYILNGNVYLDYDSVFTRNFSVTPSCSFVTSILNQMLSTLIDHQNATSVDCDLYSSLVNTYTTDGNYIALDGREYNTLPIVSVFTIDGQEDYLIDANAYDMVMKGMGYDNVFVDGDVTSWLGNILGGIFDIDLFGTISLGDILMVVLGVALVMMVIKFFAGG